MGDEGILMSFCHWGKKCTILLSDVDNGGDYGCGGKGVWKTSVPSIQFQWELKTSLKIYSLSEI